MTEIPYYSSWWQAWAERKSQGEVTMSETSETIEFCCPNCGRNDQISENVAVLAEYIGRFNKDGIHCMDDGQVAIIGDSVDDVDVFYFCYDCGRRFDEPITIEEFNSQSKEENTDGE